MGAKFRAQTGDNQLTFEQIFANEKRLHKKVEAHESLQCVGLLQARMLRPHTRRLSDHCATSSVGAIPVGSFGRFLKRDRFDRIMRYLHFSNNAAPEAATDKAWKIRPIVETLQRTFRSGYQTPPILSFDEAMVPSRGHFNPMRQIIGSLLRKNEQQASSGPTPADDNSGPAATLRNMNAVLPPKQDGVYYAVVTDRFYTSIQSALQLLKRNVYSVGTIQTNKKGFPPVVQEKSKRPKDIPRRTTKSIVAKSVPQMSAMV
ncbi:hypothetical protein PF005_g27121 [Phytophthora fragariae]|uniref:PiggyBac transposable element-derived protein domain-containing protein n=1 Tax=Phytophthora fragariae TaxID=53985 RepID=A0A6A3VU29_9STRA|nr:hypothetical protein PF005_g27121 [Phytophthora fragariae]KAE9186994.1 hypothetical protein PF002_g25721 [Phytophthora fragariae]